MRRVTKAPYQLEPGEYTKAEDGWWARTPTAPTLLASLKNHQVEEHEDGTITVSPSILVEVPGTTLRWHGYLKDGNWQALPDCCGKG